MGLACRTVTMRIAPRDLRGLTLRQSQMSRNRVQQPSRLDDWKPGRKLDECRVLEWPCEIHVVS